GGKAQNCAHHTLHRMIGPEAPFNRMLTPTVVIWRRRFCPESFIVVENYDCSTAATEAAAPDLDVARGCLGCWYFHTLGVSGCNRQSIDRQSKYRSGRKRL